MKIFQHGGEIHITHQELCYAVEYYLKEEVFAKYGSENDMENIVVEDLVVSSVSAAGPGVIIYLKRRQDECSAQET